MPQPLPSTTREASGHSCWLDWLRFGAALMVTICHARGGNWTEWGQLAEGQRTTFVYLWFAATRAGLEWVIVFFVLSGFLVGGKVLERVAAGTFDLTSYTIDRLSRIYVPLIPALALSAVVGSLHGLPVLPGELLGNLLGLQGVFCRVFAGNAPLWSLSYEIWFYVLAGCAAVLLNFRSPVRAWAYVGLALGFAAFTRLETAFLFSWILGAAGIRLVGSRLGGRIACVGLVFVLLGGLCSQLSSDTLSLDTASLRRFLPSRTLATLILSFGLALVLPRLSEFQPGSGLTAAIGRLGVRLAAFSYTLYLTHYPILELWGLALPKRSKTVTAVTVFLFVAKVISCVLAAWLLYLPFEAQTGVARRWLRQRLSRRATLEKS